MTHEPLRALLVDVGGTLVDDATWLDRERYQSLTTARLRGAFGSELPWFAPVVALSWAESDAPSWEQRTAEVVTAFLAEQGMEASAEDVERICRACAAPLSQVVELSDGAREAIRAIRGFGVRMVICSNTLWRNDADARRDWEELGFGDYFDAYVTSHDTGFGKPHPAMFKRALAAVEAEPSAAAIIGDRPELDIAGARSVGMRSIWMRPPDFIGRPEPEPDAEVSRWVEVPPIIEAWLQVGRPADHARVTIRRGTPDDAEEIADVHVRSWQAVYRGLLPDEVIEHMVAGRPARADRFRELLADADGPRRGWVAIDGSSVVGMAVTAPSRDPDAAPLTGELEAIYLAPEAMGRGIGRGLLACAVEDLSERGFTDATLWVLRENQRARRFYEVAGWRTDGATKDEERPGGTLHEVRYHRSLEPHHS